MERTSDGPDGDAAAHGDAYRRLLEETVGHATFMLDADGRVSMWPAVARGLYGYEADEMVGRKLTRLFADRGTPTPLTELLAEATTAPVETGGWHARRDGSVFWATCTLSPLGADDDGYAVVSRDTTERKQYERTLERQNDRLKEFTDILSHDLRTPLSVVEGRLELFRETGEAKHLTIIETTTDRMERLIDDLLRVARQGEVVAHPEPTDIGCILDTAREGALPEEVTCTYEPIPSVMAEPDRLVQLFENLLRNSVEHSSTDSRSETDDSQVHITVGPLDDGFYVADDGPGIPEEERDRVFEHGYTTNEDGTGYGLSVVRSIVGAHGWNVAVTDAAGGGARFEITGTDFAGE